MSYGSKAGAAPARPLIGNRLIPPILTVHLVRTVLVLLTAGIAYVAAIRLYLHLSLRLSPRGHLGLFAALGAVALLEFYVLKRLKPRDLLLQERRENGQCLHCGYDLTGNITGTCPECGTAW